MAWKSPFETASAVFDTYDTVLTVPLNGLPDWLPDWCVDQLGDEPISVLFELRRMSAVFGLRLAGGRDVVVKAREDGGRVASCVTAQARLAEQGCPCARPLTPAVSVGALAVHAEEYRPGGELLPGDSPDVAVRYAAVFARLMAALDDVTVAPPLPNPRWVRWDHTDSGVWPRINELDDRDQGAVPACVVDTADRVRKRLLAADLPCVLGHADFGSPRRSRRSRGRPACGRRRTTPAGRRCTAIPRCAVTPSAHRQPNASAEPTPSPSVQSMLGSFWL
ncbi:hypothetical protein ACWEO2_20815 [Nocardia sp. NPDC004278]